ncbi:Translation initiation factor 3 subunit D [Monocercomonoides exilis]|uniref:Translation initiation factor 3 subunit D n=1 Tax=Monocercomonoides exilis TaxID=2049356 RepID=UPI00355A4068|nr:Translation initiation factor 3 subunit D [Monocercomonoides exilis]|eukprot:MONOS_3693.1-p1 / transcript=MONOS_3693.1 / gene=MONOS_3693 / organism=Monocercomonoides_exilis_PA203 / gene_product=Translation initiation factor 3 subunit D / transcript_product=Translation initiation factor 3 subunit D / location=Mono_scaffold00089:116297-119233(-) / protein_length=958 / sequence_SO=supercontig / SO=protein_coding / is_pseudo=false
MSLIDLAFPPHSQGETSYSPSLWGPPQTINSHPINIQPAFTKLERIPKVADFISPTLPTSRYGNKVQQKYQKAKVDDGFHSVESTTNRVKTKSWEKPRQQAQHSYRTPQYQFPQHKRKYPQNQQNRMREQQVEIPNDWRYYDMWNFQVLSKKVGVEPPSSDILLLGEVGTVGYFNDSFDKATTNSPIHLRPSTSKPVDTTTSEDPFLMDIATSPGRKDGVFFATDEILAVIMASARSVYQWEIRMKAMSNGAIILDKVNKTILDSYTVNENAYEAPQPDAVLKDVVNIIQSDSASAAGAAGSISLKSERGVLITEESGSVLGKMLASGVIAEPSPLEINTVSKKGLISVFSNIKRQTKESENLLRNKKQAASEPASQDSAAEPEATDEPSTKEEDAEKIKQEIEESADSASKALERAKPDFSPEMPPFLYRYFAVRLTSTITLVYRARVDALLSPSTKSPSSQPALSAAREAGHKLKEFLEKVRNVTPKDFPMPYEFTNPSSSTEGVLTPYVSLHCLNELDSRVTGWTKILETKTGMVLSTEAKNNSFRLSRWLLKAHLAHVNVLKLGFVARLSSSSAPLPSPALSPSPAAVSSPSPSPSGKGNQAKGGKGQKGKKKEKQNATPRAATPSSSTVPSSIAKPQPNRPSSPTPSLWSISTGVTASTINTLNSAGWSVASIGAISSLSSMRHALLLTRTFTVDQLSSIANVNIGSAWEILRTILEYVRQTNYQVNIMHVDEKAFDSKTIAAQASSSTVPSSSAEAAEEELESAKQIQPILDFILFKDPTRSTLRLFSAKHLTDAEIREKEAKKELEASGNKEEGKGDKGKAEDKDKKDGEAASASTGTALSSNAKALLESVSSEAFGSGCIVVDEDNEEALPEQVDAIWDNAMQNAIEVDGDGDNDGEDGPDGTGDEEDMPIGDRSVPVGVNLLLDNEMDEISQSSQTIPLVPKLTVLKP